MDDSIKQALIDRFRGYLDIVEDGEEPPDDPGETADLFSVLVEMAALRSEVFYVGAIGSRRTQAQRREQLMEAGLTEAELERVHGPAGLDLGADSPAETALSILAEALAVRAARTGTPLKTAAGSTCNAQRSFPLSASGPTSFGS